VSRDANVQDLLAAGDSDGAATEVLQDLGPPILGWLRALHGKDDGDEVFAEFAERLWKGLPAFRGESPVRSWAYRIAWNASHSFRDDAWRRRRRRLQTSAASRLAAQVSGSAGAPRDEARLARLRELVSPEDHSLLVLRLDREMAWEEIAGVLSAAGGKVTAAALRKRYERLKERLARLARDEGLVEGQERVLAGGEAGGSLRAGDGGGATGNCRHLLFVRHADRSLRLAHSIHDLGRSDIGDRGRLDFLCHEQRGRPSTGQ